VGEESLQMKKRKEERKKASQGQESFRFLLLSWIYRFSKIALGKSLGEIPREKPREKSLWGKALKALGGKVRSR